MKKFRLALMALAVISFAGFSSCNGGATSKDNKSAADTTVNATNETGDQETEDVDQAVKTADQSVVKDSTAATDTTAASDEEGTEEAE